MRITSRVVTKIDIDRSTSWRIHRNYLRSLISLRGRTSLHGAAQPKSRCRGNIAGGAERRLCGAVWLADGKPGPEQVLRRVRDQVARGFSRDDTACTGIRGRSSVGSLRCCFVIWSDSIALSAGLDPEDFGAIIAGYRRCITENVASFGGFVARHHGDGAVVYFGYPHAHEDDAERAVQAGLALVQAVAALPTREAERACRRCNRRRAGGRHVGQRDFGGAWHSGDTPNSCRPPAIARATRERHYLGPHEDDGGTAIRISRSRQRRDQGDSHDRSLPGKSPAGQP